MDEDHQGAELPHETAAHAAAQTPIRKLWGDLLFQVIDPAQCFVDVVNEKGMVIAAVSAALAARPND
jgi:hypothetical protein